jgi:pilus assembly protein FimV
MAPSGDIDEMLRELGSSTEHDEVVDELTIEEPVIDRDEQLPELDLPLDIDALEGVEHVETDSGPGGRFELPDEPAGAMAGDEDDAEAMELKLELARAYLEIGDVEGARDILGKVVEGSMSGEQLEEARALLKALK